MPLKKEGLRGKRIVIATQMIPGHVKVKELFNKAIEAMKEAGAECVEVEFEHVRKWGQPSYEVLLYEFKADLNSCVVGFTKPTCFPLPLIIALLLDPSTAMCGKRNDFDSPWVGGTPRQAKLTRHLAAAMVQICRRQNDPNLSGIVRVARSDGRKENPLGGAP